MKSRKQSKYSPPVHLIGTAIHHTTKGLYNRDPKIIDTYRIKQLLGSGGFAACFLAIKQRTGQKYALKVIQKQSQMMKKQGATQRLNTEIKIMKSCSHFHIVTLYNDFQDEKNYYLVLQYCQKICLQKMMQSRKLLTQIETKYFIRQLIDVLYYLNQRKIIHRDIKSCNIMLDKSLNIKLGDFGLATYEYDQSKQRYCVCGTPNYMAPQVNAKKQYGLEIDMWSTGVLTYHLLYGVHPFRVQKKGQNLKQKILTKQYKFPVSKTVSDTAKDFISNLLQFDPHLRIKPKQALQHKFLQQDIARSLPQWVFQKQPSSKQLKYFIRPQNENRQFYKAKATNTFSRIPDNIIHRQQKKPYKAQIPSRTQETPPKTQKQKIDIKKLPRKGSNDSSNKHISPKNIENRKNQEQKIQQKLQRTQKKKKQAIIIRNLVKISHEKQMTDKNTKIKVSPHKRVSIVREMNTKQQNVIKYQKQSRKQEIQQVFREKSRVMVQPYIKIQASKIPKKQQEEQFVSQPIEVVENDKNQKTQSMQQIDDPPYYRWLMQQLGQELYVYQFQDKSHKYGFCFHLSNSVRMILFKDQTCIAMMSKHPDKFIYRAGLSSKSIKFYKISENNATLQISKKLSLLTNFMKSSNQHPNFQAYQQQNRLNFNNEIQDQLRKSIKYIECWCQYKNKQKYQYKNPQKNAKAYLFSTSKFIQIFFLTSALTIYILKQPNDLVKIIISKLFSMRVSLTLPKDLKRFKQLISSDSLHVLGQLILYLLQTKKKKYEYDYRKKQKITLQNLFIQYCGIQYQP